MAEKESKKRKRQSNGVQTPSKKVAVESDVELSKNIKVNHIQDGANPIIVSAAGLNVPDIPFKAYSRAHNSGSVGSEMKPSSHQVLLQSSEHPRLDYSALPMLDEHLSHYVAVYDPSNDQLHMTPVHRLDMSVKVRAEEEEMAQRGNIMQQREALGREFGTKKARKALASKTENAITVDFKGKGKATDSQAAILDTVGETASKIAVKDETNDAQLLLATRPIPRPNMDADTVEEVYSFGTLVPANASKQLQTDDWREKIRAGEDIKHKYRFPAAWIRDNGSSADEQKLKALLYVSLLLEFNSALTRAGQTSKKVPKRDFLTKRLSSWSSQLIDSVRRRFADENGGELTKWHLDNLYSHICALALYVNGWVTDTSDLRDDLSMDNKQMSQYFQELGCKVAPPTAAEQNARKLSKVRAANTRIARLKVPLEFPKPRKGRQQR